MKAFRFSDYDINATKIFLNNFYAYTRLHSAIIYYDDIVITNKIWRPICTKYHRTNPETFKCCEKNENELIKQLENGKVFPLSECDNGLIDVAFSVNIDNVPLAIVILGQFLFEKPNLNFFIDMAESKDFDKNKYLKEIEKIPVIRRNQLKKTLNFLKYTIYSIFSYQIKSKKLEEETSVLRQRELYFKKIFNETNTIIVVTDEYDQIIDFNDFGAFKLNFKKNSILGKEMKSTLELISEDFLFPQKGGSKEFLTRINSRNKCILWTSNKFIASNGKTFHVYTGEDVTKSKNSESKINKKNEVITTLYEKLMDMEKELKKQYDTAVIQNEIIKESENRYKLATEGVNEVIWDIDLISDNIFISEKISELLEVEKNSIKNFDDFIKYIHTEDKETVSNLFKKIMDSNKDLYEDEFRLITGTGEIKWIHIKGIIIRNSNGKGIRIAGSLTDLTKKKENEERIKFLAFYDSLTELYNKNKILIEIDNIIKEGSTPLQIYLINIDNFKYINDIYGNHTGDEVLLEISRRLKDLSHVKGYLVARQCNNEFSIVSPGKKNKTIIKKEIQEITATIKKTIFVQNQELRITASIGVVGYPDNGMKGEELLLKAEHALNQAKKLGKNTCSIFNESLYNESITKIIRIEEIKKSINSQDFYTVFQPKINLKTMKKEGFEVLIRWLHPEKGIINPDEFIPISEETGIIKKIDFWVIKDTVQKIKKWKETEKNMGTIAINLSPVTLNDDDYLDRIIKFIDDSQINKEKIQFEITENVFIESYEKAVKKVNELKSHGFKIALDDFGKGFSSLSYLKTLPIDVLKIDKSFIDDLPNRKNALVDLIIKMGHRLKIKIVAEGVENEMQLEYLIKHSCDIAQGYYFSKPLKIEFAEKFR